MSSAAPPRAKHDRIQVLDAFRAIAIIAVLLFHYLYRWAAPFNPADLVGLSHSYPFVKFGYLGVEFFFIISGFVIYMTLERCDSVVQFFVRRFARLYPAYVVALVVSFLIVNAFGPAEFHRSVREFLYGLTMQSAQFNVQYVDGVYWSLFVEIRFYMWAGLIYLLSGRHFDRNWCIFALLAAGAGRISDTLGELYFMSAYIPFFSFGLFFYRRYSSPENKASVMLLLTGIVCYVVAWHAELLAVHAIVLGMLLAFHAFCSGWLRWLTHPALLFFGEISYSLYLVHQKIGVIVIGYATHVLHLPDILALLLGLGCAIGLAFLITKYVEHVWKRRITRFAETRLIPALSGWRSYRWLRYQTTK